MELPSLQLDEVRRQKRNRNPAVRAQHPYPSYSEARRKVEYVSEGGTAYYFDGKDLIALLPIGKGSKLPEENKPLLLYHLPSHRMLRVQRVTAVISHPRRKTARVEVRGLEDAGPGSQTELEWAYPTYKPPSP